MADHTQKHYGLLDHLEHTFFRVRSAFRIANVHEFLISFHQKILVRDSKSIYILLTSSFVFFFFLFLAYYRLLSLSTRSRSILRRKHEFQEISKDRIKNYLLDVLEESFI